MEAALGSQNQRRTREFPGVSVSTVSCSSSDAPSPSTATLRFTTDESGSPQLQLHREASVGFIVCVDVRTSQVYTSPSVAFNSFQLLGFSIFFAKCLDWIPLCVAKVQVLFNVSFLLFQWVNTVI